MLRTVLPRPALRSLRPCSFLPPARTRPFSLTGLRLLPRAGSPAKPPPSFREQIHASQSEPLAFGEQVKPSIRNQVLFAVLGAGLVFAWAVEKTNAETQRWVKLFRTSSAWKLREPSNDELRRAQFFDLAKRLQKAVSTLGDMKSIPISIRYYLSSASAAVAQAYLDASDGRRMCWKICLINTAVFVAWKFPAIRGAMTRRFVHHPLSGLSYTLLTSMFSHMGLLHLIFNCMALNSFGSAAVLYLTREQANGGSGLQESSARYHFLAFYIAAGLFAGLTSHVVAAKILYPRMVARLAASAAPSAGTIAATASTAASAASKSVQPIRGSLGASGAIYAAVVVSALGFPESEIALAIPPTFPIPIQWGVGGMVAMDIIGALRGWRLFDHWAHLGGAAFGALYFYYGPQLWDRYRKATTVKPESH